MAEKNVAGKEHFKCCNCSETSLDLLKSLYCEHTYCIQCLRNLPRKNNQLECSVCFSRSEVLAGLSITSLPAPFMVEAMTRFKKSNDGNEMLSCPNSSFHPFPFRQFLNGYCYLCHVLFCSDCDGGKHIGHHQEVLSNESQLCTIPKADVKSVLYKVEEETTRIREAIDQIEVREEQITSQGEKVKEDFSEIKRKLIKFLDHSEERIRQEVDNAVKRKISVLKDQMQSAEDTSTKLEECVNSLKSLEQGRDEICIVPGSKEHSHTVCQVSAIVSSVKKRSYPLLEVPDITLSKKWQEMEEGIKTAMTWKPIYYTFHPHSVDLLPGNDNTSAHHVVNQISKLDIVFPHSSPCGQLPPRVSCSVNPIKAKRNEQSSVPIEIMSTSVPLRFTVSFTPTDHGLHKLEVMVNDAIIPNSPFVFKVHRSPSADNSISVRSISDVEAPYGIDVTCCGDVVITELNTNSISVFNGGGTKLESFKLKESDSIPFGLACCGTDTVYVTDKGRHEVSKYTLQGECIATVGGYGSLPGQFNEPTGIAIDHRKRNVYVADTKNHRIQVLCLDLSFKKTLGGIDQKPDLFKEPCDIAVDSNSFIYVADSLNHRVQKLSSHGEVFFSISGKSAKFDLPVGVSVDQRDFVYVSDMKSQYVSVFNSNGDFIYKFTLPPPADVTHDIEVRMLYFLNRGNGPAQLAFDHDESLLYICNPINNRVCVHTI